MHIILHFWLFKHYVIDTVDVAWNFVKVHKMFQYSLTHIY